MFVCLLFLINEYSLKKRKREREQSKYYQYVNQMNESMLNKYYGTQEKTR